MPCVSSVSPQSRITPPRFELGQKESESPMLPLHHGVSYQFFNASFRARRFLLPIFLRRRHFVRACGRDMCYLLPYYINLDESCQGHNCNMSALQYHLQCLHSDYEHFHTVECRPHDRKYPGVPVEFHSSPVQTP